MVFASGMADSDIESNFYWGRFELDGGGNKAITEQQVGMVKLRQIVGIGRLHGYPRSIQAWKRV